jgi:hypothetical protein
MHHHPFGMMIFIEHNNESYRIKQGYLRSATEIMGPAPDDTYSWCHATQLKLIMTVGPLPDALEPGFHGVRTHSNRGLMSFRLTRRRDEADS